MTEHASLLEATEGKRPTAARIRAAAILWFFFFEITAEVLREMLSPRARGRGSERRGG